MKNVIVYIRVSTPKQKKEWESLEDQIKAIQEYCKLQNFNIIKIFSDDFTGTTSNRPWVLEMYEYLNKSQGLIDIKYCVIRQIDRSSRGWIKVYEEFKDNLANFNIELKDTYWVIQWKRRVVDNIWDVDLNYDFCYNEPSKSSEAMMAIMAEEERKQILRRTIPREIALEQEWYQVRPSNYGFENKKIHTDKGKRTIQAERPIEWAYVKEMFQGRIKGVESDQEIMDRLFSKGCRTRRGKEMPVKQMQRIIANPIYAGVRISKWTWNKPIKTKYKGLVSIKVWNGANKWKTQLISWKNGDISIQYYQWEELKAEPIKIKRKNYNPEYPYSKVLMCPECKGVLTANTSRSKNWSLHYYYQCRGKNGIQHSTYSLKRENTHDTILNIFKNAKPNNEVLEIFDETADEVFEEIKADKRQNVLSYENQFKKIDKKAQNILTDIDKVMDFPIILERKNKELESLKIEKQKLELAQKIDEKETNLKDFKHYAKKLIAHTDKLAIQSQKPKYIQLAFKVVFGWRIEYEKIACHTPTMKAFFPILSHKKNSSEDEFEEKDKWGAKNFFKHTESMNKSQKVKLKSFIYHLIEIYEENPFIKYINFKKLK